jgi:hypothetical protein
MLTEDFCSYEIAKLLKEKGFDEPCNGRCSCKEGNVIIENYPISNESLKYHPSIDGISMPTHQMACKWLRESYGIFIGIKPYNSYYEDKYEFSIYKKQNTVIFDWEVLDIEDSLFEGYENTVEAAIKYCLENLI